MSLGRSCCVGSLAPGGQLHSYCASCCCSRSRQKVCCACSTSSSSGAAQLPEYPSAAAGRATSWRSDRAAAGAGSVPVAPERCCLVPGTAQGAGVHWCTACCSHRVGARRWCTACKCVAASWVSSCTAGDGTACTRGQHHRGGAAATCGVVHPVCFFFDRCIPLKLGASCHVLHPALVRLVKGCHTWQSLQGWAAAVPAAAAAGAAWHPASR